MCEKEREMGRAPCCDKANVKKGPWSPEEDSKLKEYIEKYGTGGNWIALPQKAGKIKSSKDQKISSLQYRYTLSPSFLGCFDMGFFLLIIRFEEMWKELQTAMAKLSETQH